MILQNLQIEVLGPMFLLLLAGMGLANAIYFTLLYYRIVKPDSRKIPLFCSMEERTCEAVVFTRYGRIFYVPNSLLGIIFYLLIIGGAASKFVTGRYLMIDYALAGSGFTIVLGVYLIYALLVKLKTPCPL